MPLLNEEGNTDQIFISALDVELEKISSFYQLKELEIYGEVSEFLKDEEAYKAEADDVQDENEYGRPGSTGRPRQNSNFRSFMDRRRRSSTISKSMSGGVDDSEDDDDDDDEATLQRSRQSIIKRRRSNQNEGHEDMRASTEFMRRSSIAFDDYTEQAFSALSSSGITLKKRAISLFVQLCELKSFIQLNKTGFSKVLKKYDKTLDQNLKSKYMEHSVLAAYPFRPETVVHIEENIAMIENAYADIVTQGDMAAARKELRLHLREHVVWERNTVWRELIGIERKSQAANLGIRRTLLGPDTDPAKARLQGDDDGANTVKELKTPMGRFRYPTWLLSPSMFVLLSILIVFFILLYVQIMEKVEQQNCLAMLVFISLLWATEV